MGYRIGFWVAATLCVVLSAMFAQKAHEAKLLKAYIEDNDIRDISEVSLLRRAGLPDPKHPVWDLNLSAIGQAKP